jgi:hypothetical protein
MSFDTLVAVVCLVGAVVSYALYRYLGTGVVLKWQK